MFRGGEGQLFFSTEQGDVALKRWFGTQLKKMPESIRRLEAAQAAARTAIAFSQASGTGAAAPQGGPGMPLRLRHALFDRLVYAKLRAAVGGRVAVHCQTAEGSRNAVVAGADSLEHGMHLDPDLLDTMAAQGTAYVPTLSVFSFTASGSL